MNELVIVTKSVLSAMVRETLNHLGEQSGENLETAFDLAGFITSAGTAIVTTVIPPVPSDIVRRYATVKLGGKSQGMAVSWLAANTRMMRKLGIIPAELEFAYLHSGHSHHELGVGSYSPTDESTIVKMVKEIGLKVAVGPLLTVERVGPKLKWKIFGADSVLTFFGGNKVWVKFYYYSQAMLASGQTDPIVVRPTIVEDKSAPPMPPLSWRYLQPEIFAEQMRHLNSHHCEVQVVEREIKNGPPMEIQFLVSHRRWRATLSIVTNWDFPQTAPAIQILSDKTRDVTVTWSSDMDIMDVILNLEDRGEL